MTTRQKIKAFSVAVGVCAAFSPCLAAGTRQAAKPKAAAHKTAHRLNVIFFSENDNTNTFHYRFLWAVPEEPDTVRAAPPQDWLDAIPSGDTVEVNMPFYSDTKWSDQMGALTRACEKRHISVKRTYESYRVERVTP